MKTERELYQEHYKTNRDYKFYVKHEMTEKQIFEFKNGEYSVGCVNDGWGGYGKHPLNVKAISLCLLSQVKI